ncbi:hypothetical protein FQZ97_1161910 [compost metagenome]
MVVAAHAQGQGQVVAQMPFVLNEQGGHPVLEGIDHHAFDHFGFPPLAAEGQVVVADTG